MSIPIVTSVQQSLVTTSFKLVIIANSIDFNANPTLISPLVQSAALITKFIIVRASARPELLSS